MSVNIHTVEFERRDAYLSELDERPPYTVHGVALGSNDVTVGQSGIKKLWPAEALEKSADTLQGRSLVVDHNNSSDGVVGQVTKAGYKDGTGVIYEAELFDKELAEKISNGLLEVSIRGKHSDVDNMEENDDGAKIVRDIVFDNLSIVPTGAAPSNTISIGETAELSVAQLSRFMSQLQEIDPGMWVESDDIKGITISQIRDGQVEVDIYEESDGTWRSTEETKMMSTNDLSEWDVDEDNVGGAQKDEELIGISSVPDNLRFVSKQDAMDFAEQQQILTGVHQVDDIWVPGDNHDQFIKWTRSQERKDIGNNPLRKNSVLSEGASFSRGDWVNWNTRNSTEIGKVIGGYMEGDDLPDIRGDRGLSPEGDDVLYTLRMYKKRDGTWHPISGDPIAHYERSVRAADKPSDVSDTYVELSSGVDVYSLAELAVEPTVSRPKGGDARAVVHTPVEGDFDEDDVQEVLKIVKDELGTSVDAEMTNEGIMFGPQPTTGSGETEFLHLHLDVMESAVKNVLEISQKSTLFAAGDADGHSIQPCFRTDEKMPESVMREIARLYDFVTGIDADLYYLDDKLSFDTGKKSINHVALDIAEILTRRMGDENGIVIETNSFGILPEANSSMNVVSLGRSNVSQYDVEAEQWVQWYPTDTTEAHGFSVSVDDDSVEIEKWHQNSDGRWATYGDTVTKDMEEVEPWGNFPREQEDFADAIEDGDPRKNPAQGPQRLEGSDVNPEGSAASASAEQLDEDITFSDSIETGLKNKVEEHNEEHGDEEGKRVTYRMLKAVYRRGAGAYSDSHREGMTRQQWSYARVNAFLYLVRNGNPENDNYTQDNDLLPDEHPKYSDAEENSLTTADSISQDAYGLHNPMGSGVEEPPQKIEQDVLDAELASDMSELDEVYSEWSETVNMTASELERWSGHPCSREASLNPVAVIERNLTLLKANKSDWDESHIEDAKRTISFVKRMRGARGDGEQKTSGTHGCPTNWAISLMNWAFNPFDEIPSVPENDNLNEVSQVELMSMIREGMRFFSTVNHTMVRITNVEGDLASVMSGSDSQWIEQKEDIIEKVAEGDWKYAGHSMGPMMEQMAENMPSSPIPMPEEAQLLYPTEEKAMAAAEKMGMMGSHSHMLDGDRWHMPGKSHEMFVERMMDMGDMEGLAEAEMVLASYSENGYHGMDEEEEMAMNMPSSPIPMPKDAQLLYPTEEKAMAAAEKMGMMGSHSHMLDGDRWYMPGKSHEMFVERMMEMGDMEGLAEAEMVLASYSENGYHGMDEEEMSKHMSSSPIPMPEDAQLLYPTEKKAMAAADEMGIMGSHSHMLNGEMWYMPGKSHEMFVERMMEMGDMERLAEAEMVLASYSENGYHGADDDEDEDMESQMMGRTEFSDGDMVQWDVMPSLYGQVVHNPEDDPVIMVEIMENDNGMMKTTHHTISAYPSDIRMMRGMDELQSIEAHMPEFTGTTESDWSSPDMEDFDTDDMSEIAKHYLVSKSGFPPENFGDLALPVVGPEGDLYLNALQNAKARGSQVSGLSGDMLDEVMSMINSLANDNFESADFEEMKIGGGVPRKTTSLVRVLTGDDLWQSDGETKESEMDEIATKVTNMNDDIEQKLAELNEPVAVEQDDLEELQEKADRFSEMSSTLEALKERTDILDSVDREQVEELAEAEEPVVVESARMETLSEEAEQVAETYASELASESFLTAEELTDKFTIGELREKYEEQIGNPAEELASSEDAEPKSGDVDEEELQERAGSDEEELSSESDEAEQMREELRNKILG